MTAGSLSRRVEQSILDHGGWAGVEEFGELLGTKFLTPKALQIFVATQLDTVKEAPQAILGLGLRIADDCVKRDRFGALKRAQGILLAAADEYGLHNVEAGLGITHFELCRCMIHAVGLTEQEVIDGKLVFPEARDYAAVIRHTMRERPIPVALGFHLALEMTAEKEWSLCYEGFKRRWQDFGLRGEVEVGLSFYYTHSQQEPMHGVACKETIDYYGTLSTDNEEMMLEGAKVFMDYFDMWIRGANRLFS